MLKLRSVTLFITVAVICASAYSEESTDVDTQLRELATAYVAARDANDRNEALAVSREAYALAIENLADDDKRLTTLARYQSEAAYRVRSLVEARNQAELAIIHAQRSQKGASAELFEAHINAITAQATGRDSIRSTKAAIKTAKKLYGEQSADFIESQLRAAIALLTKTRSKKALRYFEDAYDTAIQHLSTTDISRARATYWRGRADISAGRNDSAIPYLLEAADLFEGIDLAGSSMALSAQALLVEAYVEIEQPEKATDHLLTIARESVEVDDRDVLPIYRVAPVYPMMARQRKLNGYIDFEFTVNVDGRTQNLVITGAENADIFAEAARTAVLQWRFAPRIVDGEPTPRRASTRLRFEMNN